MLTIFIICFSIIIGGFAWQIYSEGIDVKSDIKAIKEVTSKQRTKEEWNEFFHKNRKAHAERNRIKPLEIAAYIVGIAFWLLVFWLLGVFNS